MGRARGGFGAVSALIAVVAWGGPARAWNFDEHREIGTRSYLAACCAIRADTEVPRVCEGPPGDTLMPPDQLMACAAWHVRRDLACPASPAAEVLCSKLGEDTATGRLDEDQPHPPANALAALAIVYGQATAIAGDHLDDPDTFVDRAAGAKVHSVLNYGKLAVENHAHFHPAVVREWRRHFGKALARAATADDAGQPELAARYEELLYLGAYADHFLQDSFASGHMGFNRPASGTAAAKTLHDRFNADGRWVYSREQTEGWKTFGDAHWRSDCRESICGERVIAANTASVERLLRTFVDGRRSTWDEQRIAAQLPTEATSPRVRSVLFWDWAAFTRKLDFGRKAAAGGDVSESAAEAQVNSIAAFHRPAYIALGAGGGGGVQAVDFDAAEGVVGFGMGSATTSLMSFMRLTLDVGGAAIPEIGDTPAETAFLAGLGLQAAIDTSADGLFTHELEVGARWLAADHPALLARVGYRLNLEVAKAVVPLSLGWGAVWREGEVHGGPAVSLELIYVFRAMGGGFRYQ